jgi:hypothetical protein
VIVCVCVCSRCVRTHACVCARVRMCVCGVHACLCVFTTKFPGLISSLDSHWEGMCVCVSESESESKRA